MDLNLLAGAVFFVTGGSYYLTCAMRSAITIEYAHTPLAAVTTAADLAWYYRPAEVFLRQVINARSQGGLWRI